jgi:hypothetical protein
MKLEVNRFVGKLEDEMAVATGSFVGVREAALLIGAQTTTLAEQLIRSEV